MGDYTARNIKRVLTGRLAKQVIDLSGWHVMEGGQWLHGPMDQELAVKMAAAYNDGDRALVRDCHDIIQHGRVLTKGERDALCKRGER